MTHRKKTEQLIAGGNKVQPADNVIDNNISFKCLIYIYIRGPYRTTQHAAAAITEIAVARPHIIRPYWGLLLTALCRKSVPVAFKRNTLRLMQFVIPPSVHQGRIIDLCFGYLSEPTEPVAVKVFAMSVIEILSRNHVDLRRELAIILEDQLAYASPGYRSRATKVLKALKKTPVQATEK